MNVGQYRALLGELELKKAEVLAVHDQYAYGYAKTVLSNAMTKVQAEIDELLSIELMPVPTVIGITSSLSTINAVVGATTNLLVTARMSDGSSKDVTKAKYAKASFKDYDTVFNNTGLIQNVDVSAYALAADEKYKVVKTANGWNVYDSIGTSGLAVVSPVANTFDIVDIDGNPIGVRFETDGNEAKGDNWTISVDVELTGTIYTSSDTNVVAVDGNGGIIAVGAGSAVVTITNGAGTVNVNVTVA